MRATVFGIQLSKVEFRLCRQPQWAYAPQGRAGLVGHLGMSDQSCTTQCGSVSSRSPTWRSGGVRNIDFGRARFILCHCYWCGGGSGLDRELGLGRMGMDTARAHLVSALFRLVYLTSNARCAALAINVYVDNSCIPSGTKFSLPPVWLLLGRLGMTSGAVPWLAPLFEVSAIVVFAALMRGRTVKAAVAALAALLSPSVMLGFERGNVDLIIFVLVGSAALLFAAETRTRVAASFGLLALAVVAKLYPIFCCAVAVRSRRLATFAGALLLLGGAYLIGIADYLPLIRGNTPVVPDLSYGYLVPFMWVERDVAPHLGFSAAGLSASAAPILLIAIWCAMVAGGSVVLWRRGTHFCSLSAGTAGTAFIFGAAIYCGSFLFNGSNWAYREIFLLLCLPQLFDWVGGPPPNRVTHERRLGRCSRCSISSYGACSSAFRSGWRSRFANILSSPDWPALSCLTACVSCLQRPLSTKSAHH